MNLSCCLYQVQREAFGIILDSQLHASAALFLNNARACDHPCVLFAVIMDYFIHCFIHQFCLQLVTTSCGFAVNSSYHNIINYLDNLVRISQNIMIILFLVIAQAYSVNLNATVRDVHTMNECMNCTTMWHSRTNLHQS